MAYASSASTARRVSNAVWRAGGGPQQVAVAVDLEELRQTDADLFGRGMRLVDLGVGGWE